MDKLGCIYFNKWQKATATYAQSSGRRAIEQIVCCGVGYVSAKKCFPTLSFCEKCPGDTTLKFNINKHVIRRSCVGRTRPGNPFGGLSGPVRTGAYTKSYVTVI